MRKIIYSVLLFSFLFSSKSFSTVREWVSLTESTPVKVKPLLTSLAGDRSEISFQLTGFYKEEIKTPRGNAYSITVPGGAKILQAGLPDLPLLAYSLIIPDGSEMKAEVISSQYTDYQYSIAPSKGNLKRDINPDQVPFTYSTSYSINEFVPKVNVALRNPYVLRDFRGQSVVIYPFQYNPITQILRVFHSMTIRVSPTGNSSNINNLNRRGSISTLDPSFSSIYRKHFLNFSPLTYTPLNEHGKMLVISDPTLMSTMEPFVNWKNRMGQPTEMVDVTTIGINPQDIKTYIENYYNTNGLTFVLLVGDGPQIPPFTSVYGDSDPSYGYISGNDSYAEVIVGRFSANNTEELQTQVQRTLTYEMYPDPNGDWYHKGVCIGSDQGPGDDNEMDFEHERNISTDYLGYTYTTVDELYDGSQGVADAAGNPDVTDFDASLNSGRSVITYTGHGSTTSFGTTGFSSTDVTGLTNVNMLPFIWSVACVNGDFKSGTCLAESFLRSTTATGEPTGAIATFMATINQSWDPPMDAQDEMVDILVESYPGNIKHTFGGISVNGCMHMNDVYGAAGDEMTDTWTTFGDPSLTVRTNTPVALVVSHASTINETQTSFNVNCPKNGAQVCLSKDNHIISVGYTLSGSAILSPSGLQAGDTLDLVVTAYNSIPYFSQVVVTSSSTGIISISQNDFSFFPNPTKGKLTFNLNYDSKDVTLRMINSIGQTELIAQCKNAGHNSYEADLSSLASGIYTAVIYTNSEIFGVRKIVIQ